jgi:hypothetical protein
MARPDRYTIDVTGLVPTRRFNRNKEPLIERLMTMWSHYAVFNPGWTLHPDSRCGEYTQMVEDLLLAKNNAQAGAVWNAALAWGEKWGVVIVT